MPISSTFSPAAARVAGAVVDPAGVADRDATAAGRTVVRSAAGVLALDGVAVPLFDDPPHAASAVASATAITIGMRLLCIDADYRTLLRQANEIR